MLDKDDLEHLEYSEKMLRLAKELDKQATYSLRISITSLVIIAVVLIMKFFN